MRNVHNGRKVTEKVARSDADVIGEAGEAVIVAKARVATAQRLIGSKSSLSPMAAATSKDCTTHLLRAHVALAAERLRILPI